MSRQQASKSAPAIVRVPPPRTIAIPEAVSGPLLKTRDDLIAGLEGFADDRQSADTCQIIAWSAQALYNEGLLAPEEMYYVLDAAAFHAIYGPRADTLPDTFPDETYGLLRKWGFGYVWDVYKSRSSSPHGDGLPCIESRGRAMLHGCDQWAVIDRTPQQDRTRDGFEFLPFKSIEDVPRFDYDCQFQDPDWWKENVVEVLRPNLDMVAALCWAVSLGASFTLQLVESIEGVNGAIQVAALYKMAEHEPYTESERQAIFEQSRDANSYVDAKSKAHSAAVCRWFRRHGYESLAVMLETNRDLFFALQEQGCDEYAASSWGAL